jgi:hypothetical protein
VRAVVLDAQEVEWGAGGGRVPGLDGVEQRLVGGAHGLSVVHFARHVLGRAVAHTTPHHTTPRHAPGLVDGDPPADLARQRLADQSGVIAEALSGVAIRPRSRSSPRRE